jgi:hypothetical protein
MMTAKCLDNMQLASVYLYVYSHIWEIRNLTYNPTRQHHEHISL